MGSLYFGAGYYGQYGSAQGVSGEAATADYYVRIPADDHVVLIPADEYVVRIPADDRVAEIP